jgi:hypothetical protein
MNDMETTDEVQIIRFEPGAFDFEEKLAQFESVLTRVYAADSPRLKQKDRISLTHLKSCFIAKIKGQSVGRCSLYVNPDMLLENQTTACIGHYECINEPVVAQKLIASANAQAFLHQADQLIGPMNGSTWDAYRFSTHNDQPCFTSEPYNHLYYNEQFLAANFAKLAGYTSHLGGVDLFDHPEIVKREAELIAAGVKFRSVDIEHFEQELKRLYPFIQKAFETNFLYTPIAWEGFKSRYLEARPLLDKDFALIAEDSDNNLIGFLFAYIDYNNPASRHIIAKTLARLPSKQWAGLGYILSNLLTRHARQRNFKGIIHAYMIEDATSKGNSAAFGGGVYKSYALYNKPILS